jgi:hypothetical protein
LKTFHNVQLSLKPPTMKKPGSKSLLLIGIGFLVPMLAARAARTVAGRAYKLVTNEDPPKNPANPDVEWREALVWAAISGLVGGMSRLVARRWLAETMVPTEGDDMEEKIDELE